VWDFLIPSLKLMGKIYPHPKFAQKKEVSGEKIWLLCPIEAFTFLD
jgi:hypothetical protein